MAAWTCEGDGVGSRPNHRLQADRGPRAALSEHEWIRLGRGGWGRAVRPPLIRLLQPECQQG